MNNFEKELIQSMEEAVRMAKGERIGVTHYIVDPKEVRKSLKLSQAKMAPLLGMSTSGYRKWEQGERSVSGPAQNLLRVLQREPDAVFRALGVG